MLFATGGDAVWIQRGLEPSPAAAARVRAEAGLSAIVRGYRPTALRAARCAERESRPQL